MRVGSYRFSSESRRVVAETVGPGGGDQRKRRTCKAGGSTCAKVLWWNNSGQVSRAERGPGDALWVRAE